MPNGGNRSGLAMTGADATRNPGHDGEPGEIEALLPWYAAGTLRRRDRQRVEEALRQDAELARHVERVREEIVETIHLNETLGAVHRHGTFAMVRFAQAASAAEITNFLHNYQAALVDGPTDGGLYRVRIAMKSLAKEELGKIVARMRQERVVESAEPAEPAEPGK